MGKPGFQNGMARHEQKRKAETDGLMDILDPLGLPDEILLSVFRHLPIHIVYGSGEQEQPTGMIALERSAKRYGSVSGDQSESPFPTGWRDHPDRGRGQRLCGVRLMPVWHQPLLYSSPIPFLCDSLLR